MSSDRGEHKALDDKTKVMNGVSKVETIQYGLTGGSKLETHYNDLLKLIEDIGHDVKPSYTTSKASTDRLKKNIMVARGILRECMSDLEKLASSS